MSISINRSIVCAVAGLLALAGCAEAPVPDVNRLAERNGVITLPDPDTGVCRANDVTPAVIETITERVVTQEAVYGPDGRVRAPALYEEHSRQVVVKERQEQQFEALCEAELTPEFVGNLQRALAARGFYNGAVTGELNWRTRRGVRLYQLDQGIDSAILSKESARQLGLSAYDFERG